MKSEVYLSHRNAELFRPGKGNNKMTKLQARLAEQQHRLAVYESMGKEFFIQRWKEKIAETLAKIEALKSN